MVVAKESELYRVTPNQDLEQIRVYIDEQKGEGKFKVIFELYEDEKFTKIVNMSAPLMATGDHLRLKVILQGEKKYAFQT